MKIHNISVTTVLPGRWYLFCPRLGTAATGPLCASAEVAGAVDALALHTEAGVGGAGGAGAAVAAARRAGAGGAVTMRADDLAPLHRYAMHLLLCT